MLRERRPVGQAECAVDLHRSIDDAGEGVRRIELDQRDLDARILSFVDLVSGVERQQAAGLDLRRRVCDPVLHGLLLGEWAAERFALEGARAHQLERALHLSEPPHHVVDPARAEPLLRDQETLSLARRGDSQPVRARRCRSTSQCVVQPRPRCPSVGTGSIWIPGASAGTMIWLVRRRGSASGSVTAITIPKAAPSAPEENHLWPLITHSSPSSTAVVRRLVGSEPGDLRLGHREERTDVTGNERLQPALLLFLRAEVVEDLPVAGIGRLAVEDVLRPQHAADLLVQVSVGEETLPGSARFGREVRCPEPCRLRACAQFHDQLLRCVVLASERHLVRIDVLLHEGAVLGAQFREVGGGGGVGDRDGARIAQNARRVRYTSQGLSLGPG